MNVRCFECGTTDNIHQHHVVPRTLGGTKTIPLCEKCHGLIHGMNFSDHSTLTKIGLDNARKRGVKLGNPNLDSVRNKDTTQARKQRVRMCGVYRDNVKRKIEPLFQDGLTDNQIAEQLNLEGFHTSTGGLWNRTTVWRVRKRSIK